MTEGSKYYKNTMPQSAQTNICYSFKLLIGGNQCTIKQSCTRLKREKRLSRKPEKRLSRWNSLPLDLKSTRELSSLILWALDSRKGMQSYTFLCAEAFTVFDSNLKYLRNRWSSWKINRQLKKNLNSYFSVKKAYYHQDLKKTRLTSGGACPHT